jgi:polysaccharide biosynthesis protein PslA
MTPLNSLVTQPRRRLRFTSNVMVSLAVANDGLMLALAMPLSYLVFRSFFSHDVSETLHLNGAIIVGINFFLIRLSRDAYSNPVGRREDADLGVVFDFFAAALLVFLTILQFGLLSLFSGWLLVSYIVIASTLLFLSRFALRKLIWWLMKLGYIGQRIVIYGAEPGTAERACQLLERERLPYLTVVGVADERKTRISTDSVENIPMIGGFEDVVALARDRGVDQIVIALPLVGEQRLETILQAFAEVAVDVVLLPTETIRFSNGYRLSYIGTTPVMTLWQRPMRDLDHVMKILEDRIVALVAVILLSPLLLLTALAIRMTSEGPILFVQRRFGFNNMEIPVLKFRTMYVDQQDVSGAERTVKDDPRVTPLGKWLRRSSIDELPQLLNVLRGEMSIVGPRPHAVSMKVGDKYYFDAVREYTGRHRVKPGITGLAQVRGLRGEINTIERAHKRVEFDTYYIQNWSLMLDFRIMFETVYRLVWDKNAY